MNSEGFGICDISDKLVSCSIEIECKTVEADNCCEGKLFVFICLFIENII